MRATFDEWLKNSVYHWYARPGLITSDRKIVDAMRDAYKAGTQSEELDRAAELLRQCRDKLGVYQAAPEPIGLRSDIDAFLREIAG